MTERVTGLGRRTREEIAKWNQMTALRFQTGGRHQTSPASLQGESERRGGFHFTHTHTHSHTHTHILLLSIPFLYFFFKSGIDKSTEWSTTPACPSLMCFFNRGDTEGTNSSKILCPMFVYVLFYVNLCHD